MKDISVMINDVKLNYRVGLIIKKDDNILIEFNTEFDFTTLPGGRVKTMENSLDAIVREIKEEMGLDIEKNKVTFKTLIENFFELENIKYHELYVLYEINALDEFDKVDKNIDSKTNYYKWVNKNNLEVVNLLPKEIINIINNK